jgi:hemerythrin
MRPRRDRGEHQNTFCITIRSFKEDTVAYIQWQDDFSVKVKEIDDQHKTLIEMINSLHEAMLANRARDVQKQTISGMIDYAVKHFALEEKYMKQFGYAGYQKHKAEHDQFSAKALDLKARMDKAGFVLTLEIMNFLREWLRNHILKVDKAYSAEFTRHGLR